MMEPSQLTIATRKSELAVEQALIVQRRLKQFNKDLPVSLVKLSSQGDQLKNADLKQYGGKGLFTKRLDQAVLAGDADIAVHSLKDIPADYPEPLQLAAFMPRAEPEDAFVSPYAQTLADLPAGSVIGTSSLRRQAMVKAFRQDLKVEPIRGSVPTRLEKLDQKRYEGLVLALAGLKRLNLGHRVNDALRADQGFIPGIGQGTVVAVCHQNNHKAKHFLAGINDPETRACSLAERAFNHALGGHCHLPIAAHALFCDNMLKLSGMVSSPDGRHMIKDCLEGEPDDPGYLGQTLAHYFLEQGAEAILVSSRV